MAEPNTTLQVDMDGVAVITLSYPPLNALHPKCTWYTLSTT